MSKYFAFPFAETGDKTVIPDDSQPSQVVSYEAGFTPDYSIPQPNPSSKDVPRTSFNELMYQTTLAIQQYQNEGFPDFITTADNLGAPFPYNYNAVCRFDDGANGFRLYKSLVNNNVTLPTDIESWQKLPVLISGTSTGTANALTLNVTQNYEIFNQGDLARITASLSNLGATTLQIGLGAAIAVNKITDAGIVPLNGGEIVATGSYDFEFNGTTWILKNPVVSQPANTAQVTFQTATAQSIPPTTDTQLLFDLVSFDSNSWWNPGLFRFLPTIAGKYRVNISIYATSNNVTEEVFLKIYKTGSLYKLISLTPYGIVRTCGGSFIVEMDGTSDYLEAFVFGSGAGVLLDVGAGVAPNIEDGETSNLFEIEFLGA